MAYLLSEFRAIVDGQLNYDDNTLSQLRRERECKAAIEKYSVDRPDTYTEDVTGDGGRYYALASSLSYWTDRFSMILRIQYPAPVIASDETPVDLEFTDWDDEYWADVSGMQTRYVYLPNHAPSSAESMRITYTLPWQWVASSTTMSVEQAAHGFSVDDYVVNNAGTWESVPTIRTATYQISAVADEDNFTAKILQVDVPPNDFYAICNLATSLCCEALSARYSALGDSFVGIDSANTITKSTEYSNRAREYRELYDKHMGLLEPPAPAGTYVNIGIPNRHAVLQRRWRRPITS